VTVKLHILKRRHRYQTSLPSGSNRCTTGDLSTRLDWMSGLSRRVTFHFEKVHIYSSGPPRCRGLLAIWEAAEVTRSPALRAVPITGAHLDIQEAEIIKTSAGDGNLCIFSPRVRPRHRGGVRRKRGRGSCDSATEERDVARRLS